MIGIISALIVGSYGTFTGELINKLNKEGWRIFTLVSDRFAVKPPQVFEQYRFSYESDSMNEILGSCLPDVILFTGAYDPLFTWTTQTEAQDARAYIAGLNNILLSAGQQGIGRFIYLSSECVYQDSYAKNIVEDTMPSPFTVKGITVAQGETLAMAAAGFSSTKVTVARMADMYFIPKNRAECRDPYTRLCLQALTTGRVKVNSKVLRSALYIGDAIQALFLLFSAQERKHQVYHISAEKRISELDIAQAIKVGLAEPVDIIDESMGFTKRTVLSGRRFAEEFDFEVRTTHKEAIPKVVHYMQKHRRQFDLGRRRNWKWLFWAEGTWKAFNHLFPYIECIAIFSFVFLLTSRIGDIPYLQGANPYLLFVLLYAVIRGRALAVMAFALATGGYFFQQAQARGALSLVTGVDTYIWIAELFIVGVTAGHLRDRLTQVHQEKDEDCRFLMGRVDEISFINATNVKIKNYFQERVINSNESIGWFYNIISQLDKAASGEVIFIATEFLAHVMECKHVAIYSATGGSYCRLMASTTPAARSLGKSIDMERHSELFKPLSEGQIFLNRKLNQDLPSMASALINENEEAQVFFFLWELPYERMTLYYSNTLKMAGSLVYNAMLRATKHLEALADKHFAPGTRILQGDAFDEIWSVYERRGNKQLIEYSMLLIPRGDLPLKDWDERLKKNLRQEDIVGILPNNFLGVLLTNTSEDEAAPVIKRMKANGIPVRLVVENEEDEKCSLPSVAQ